MSGTWGLCVQSFHQLQTETRNMCPASQFSLQTWLRAWVGGEVHVLDNDCQLLYKYFNIFSAVKQNNEQMRKSQSLTSWDEFPLCTVLEISHHASLQAAQTWKYFNSTLENISITHYNKLTMNMWLLNVWKVLQMFWHHVTYRVYYTLYLHFTPDSNIVRAGP